MEENSEQAPESLEEIVGKGKLKDKIRNLWRYIVGILNLRRGLDRESTIEGIKSDVEFRGHAAWILICSILIACIGLSENNIPIIVGAMLISPLMGPILGIGLAAGINDFDLLKKSVTNFSIAIAIGLLISTIYFLIVPVPETTPELYGRRNASILAIAIAFLGGTAGIIAGSRIFKSNVVPGVAIATALMPPLCTAGYGLATANWDYCLGAFYLFLINSVFIAMPTYLYIRYMNFPLVEFVDPKKEKKIKRRVIIFIVVIMIPSALFFYQVLSDSIFDRNAKEFVSHIKADLDESNTYVSGSEVINTSHEKEIKVVLTGDFIDDSRIKIWEKELESYDLASCQLHVVQDEDFSTQLKELSKKSLQDRGLIIKEILLSSEEKFKNLHERIFQLEADTSFISNVKKEISVLYPDLRSIQMELFEDIDTLDRIQSFQRVNLFFDEAKNESEKERLKQWLKTRVKKDSVEVIINILE